MALSPEALAKIEASVLRTVATWSDDDRASWDERAAVLEYERSDTCKDRREANVLAFWQIKKERGR